MFPEHLLCVSHSANDEQDISFWDIETLKRKMIAQCDLKMYNSFSLG